MSRDEVQIVCQNALNFIVQRGAQMARDNRTIKNNLSNFANEEQFMTTNHLLIHTGAQQQKNKHLLNPQKQPTNLKKDNNCFLSVGVSPLKTYTSRQDKNSLNDATQRTTNQTSPRSSRRSSIVASRKSGLKSREANNNKFIDLTGVHQRDDPTKSRKITQAIKNQQAYIDHLRQKRIEQDQINEIQKQKDSKQQKKQQSRVEQLKNKMHRYLSEKNHKITYDIDGSMIYFSNETQQKSLTRKYPPSNTAFAFQFKEDPVQHSRNGHSDVKQRAAKGQMFASSVLKTVNLSKFSLNLTSRTCNLDQFAFMKRNDLFNNNHCRQVTTIPFLQVSEGTNYTESNTNQSVSKKKTQKTTHSDNKGKYKTHSQLDVMRENSQNYNTKTQMIQLAKQSGQLEKRRIQSSRPYARPKTCTPKTAKTSDRIISVNEQLVCELIQ